MGKVVIDKNKCKACYLCLEVCPKGTLKQSTILNSNGYYPVEFSNKDNKCIGCAACAQRCPDLAIKEVYR